jgi:hypothetical protein
MWFWREALLRQGVGSSFWDRRCDGARCDNGVEWSWVVAWLGVAGICENVGWIWAALGMELAALARQGLEWWGV